MGFLEAPYRQGFIEVQPNIHEGFINIETWMTNPKTTLDETITNLDPIQDDSDITGNTELELTFNQASELIIALQAALLKIKPCEK
jgi:hypothetical protein